MWPNKIVCYATCKNNDYEYIDEMLFSFIKIAQGKFIFAIIANWIYNIVE